MAIRGCNIPESASALTRLDRQGKGATAHGRKGHTNLVCAPALITLALLSSLGCATSGAGACATALGCDSVEHDTASKPSFPSPAPTLAAATYCGDGIWDPELEECDDGSECRDGRNCTLERTRCQGGLSETGCAPRGGDGCSTTCTLERDYTCTDGVSCRQRATNATPGATGGPGEPDAGAATTPDAAVTLDAGAATTPDAAVTLDAGPTVTPHPDPPEPPDCSLDRFQPPQRLEGLELGLDLRSPALSADGNTLFFAANRSGVVGRIFSAQRVGRGRQFSGATAVGGVDSGAGDGSPIVSSDGLTLYFSSSRANGAGDLDLWFARRPNLAAAFDVPHVVEGINGPGSDQLPWLSADELTITVASTRAGGAGGSDVWIARREVRSLAFGNPEPLSEINLSSDEGRAILLNDNRSVMFASDRAGGLGAQDLWIRRSESDDTPGVVTNLEDMNSTAQDLDPFLSSDENELLFASSRSGSMEIWRSRRGCD